VAGISFIILQIIIFRIFVEYDQLKHPEDKIARAKYLSKIMYIYIGIYISLIIGKLFLDYDNDHRLEKYRYSCKGTTKRYTSTMAIQEFLLQ
jgi:uncharacterized protein YacL